MSDLEQYRQEIDELDEQLVRLFLRRMEVTGKVGEYKLAHGMQVLDREREIKIGKYRALLTHGHYYGVSVGTERIKEEARARGCDIAMFGHTHKPYLWHANGLTVLNPGSLSFPRQEGRKPTYMIMEIDGDGEAHYTLKQVGK